jgi:transposase
MELGRDRVQTQSRKNKNNLRDRQNDQDVAVSSSADENVNEGISQRKLAEILGIDRAYLTNWQQSKKPDPKVASKSKGAYEQWKQWYLGDNQRWYPRNY